MKFDDRCVHADFNAASAETRRASHSMIANYDEEFSKSSHSLTFIYKKQKLFQQANVKVIQSMEKHVPAFIFCAIVRAPASSALDHFGTSRF
uniref:Uncharacterized protein n=1 Tax=Romanomermis culicivorax TaxID=13658 RepID=A0A915JW65_ROMCU